MKIFLLTLSATLVAFSTSRADITYLDATTGLSGNTFATGGSPADSSWINPDAETGNDNDQWRVRAFGNDATVLQALHTSNLLPEITTEITGLADGTYDVWAFFWDGPNANTWTLSAGLNSGSLATYSFDGPGDTSTPVAASSLTFANPPVMTAETPRLLYGVKLGQSIVSQGSTIRVSLDNKAGGGSNTRTWYDGVGYQLAPPGGGDSDSDGLPDSFEQTIINADASDLIAGLEDVMGTGAAPAITDFDTDGSNDAEEYARGTNPLNEDSDNDGLLDGVENLSGIFENPGMTGTDPLNADTDGDGYEDGLEVAAGTNPNLAGSVLGTRIFGVEFNKNDSLGAPSQSLFRVVSGSGDPNQNTSAYTKKVGSHQVTIREPDGANLEFRGANGDSARAIPGGDTSLSFLVSDFIATRQGAINLEITALAAGTYIFRSFHLEPFTGAALGFAQGSTPTTPNSFEAALGGVVKATVEPTVLGISGLNTTSINDAQIPTLGFVFTHDGASPLTIELRATKPNAESNFLFLNGFELLRSNP